MIIRFRATQRRIPMHGSMWLLDTLLTACAMCHDVICGRGKFTDSACPCHECTHYSRIPRITSIPLPPFLWLLSRNHHFLSPIQKRTPQGAVQPLMPYKVAFASIVSYIELTLSEAPAALALEGAAFRNRGLFVAIPSMAAHFLHIDTNT